MTPQELKRLLRKNGWEFREGTRHTLAIHPDKPGIQIPIPRHKSKDIPAGTLNNILMAAGLKNKK